MIIIIIIILITIIIIMILIIATLNIHDMNDSARPQEEASAEAEGAEERPVMSYGVSRGK